jgi:putative ABC transport system permease protein
MMKTVDYHIDEQYIPTFGMQMAAGRNFSTAFATDSSGMIINESAAKAFGWNNNTALDKTIVWVNSDKGISSRFMLLAL